MTRTKSSRALVSVVLAVLMAVAFMPAISYTSFAATAKKATKVTKVYHTGNKTYTRTVGSAWTLKYKLSPSKLTTAAKKVVWKSSNKSVVSVSAKSGNKAAVSFKKAGTATVTVYTKANKKAKATWKFKVVKPADKTTTLTGVTVSAPNVKDAVSDKVAVGTTLKANVAPEDAAGVTYQWYADGTPIDGATKASFTVTTDQIGKAISVKAKSKNEVESAATAKVASVSMTDISLKKAETDANGKVNYDKDASAVNVGDTVKVKGIAGKDANNNDVYMDDVTAAANVQWYRVTTSANGSTVETAISGATGETYTLTKEDIGTIIKAVVTPKSGVTATGLTNGTYAKSTDKVTGYATVEIQSNGKKVTSAAANTALTAVVTPSDASVSYQWYNVTKGKDIAIKGATSATYTPSEAGTYTVVATPTKDEKTYNKDAAKATVTVGEEKLGDVVIKDSDNKAVTEVSVGQAVKASVRVLGGEGSADLQWYKNGTKIDKATSASYTIDNAKVGDVFKVVATGTGKYAGSTAEASVTVKTLGSISNVNAFTGLTGDVTTNPVTGHYVLNVKNLPAKDWVLNKDYTVEFFKLVAHKDDTVTKESLGKASSTTAQYKEDKNVDPEHVIASYELTDSDITLGSNDNAITKIYASVTAPNYTGEKTVDFTTLYNITDAVNNAAVEETSKDDSAKNATLKVTVPAVKDATTTYQWAYKTNVTSGDFVNASTTDTYTGYGYGYDGKVTVTMTKDGKTATKTINFNVDANGNFTVTK